MHKIVHKIIHLATAGFKLAFSMTINKSQGQSLQYLGFLLTRPVFNHRRLHVALSRGQDSRKIRVLLEDTEPRKRGKTSNIVYMC